MEFGQEVRREELNRVQSFRSFFTDHEVRGPYSIEVAAHERLDLGICTGDEVIRRGLRIDDAGVEARAEQRPPGEHLLPRHEREV